MWTFDSLQIWYDFEKSNLGEKTSVWFDKLSILYRFLKKQESYDVPVLQWGWIQPVVAAGVGCLSGKCCSDGNLFHRIHLRQIYKQTKCKISPPNIASSK